MSETIPSRKGIERLVKLVFEGLEKLRIRVRHALLDAGFDSDEVIDYLESTSLKYCLRRKSYKSLRKLKHGAVLRKETEKGTKYRLVAAYHKKKRKKYFFITNMSRAAEELLKEFDLRWGIETSYRMHKEFLIRTTSKNYTVRLFYYLFACAVYDCWVTYHCLLERHLTVTEVKIVFIIITVLGKDALIGNENFIHT